MTHPTTAAVDSGQYGPDPLDAQPERHRYFSRKRGGLYSMRADGALYVKRLEHGWRLAKDAPANPEELAQRLSGFAEMVDKAPFWMRSVTDIPTMDEMEEWAHDSVCETPTGHTVEPDGEGPDGVPSWLRIFGLI